jgi:ParB family chromosome partitioning protein
MSTFRKTVQQRNKGKGKKKDAPDSIPTTDKNLETSSGTSTIEESTTVEEHFYGDDQAEESGKQKSQRAIPVERIRPNPYQPRVSFNQEKLQELANGMLQHGFVGGGVPVRAHPTESNIYELVFGERRWRAAKLAGLPTIPCEISTYSDDDMIELGLLENIQREDLTNLEEGRAYVNLLALRTATGKPRYSIRGLAIRISKDKSYIEDRLQYARVPLDIQQLAEDQPDISPRIIRELGELSKILQPEERVAVVEGVREGNLRIEDVREIRKEVEDQVKNTAALSSLPPLPAETPLVTLPNKQENPVAPMTPKVSVATDTSPSPLQEEQTGDVGHTPTAAASPQETPLVAAAPISPLASSVAVSVFEKTLKRDNEAIERILQRISSALGPLTDGEVRVLRRFLARWSGNIHEIMNTLPPEEEQ